MLKVSLIHIALLSELSETTLKLKKGFETKSSQIPTGNVDNTRILETDL